MGKVANFPATLADLDAIDTVMPFVANGRPMETIGQTLTRMIEKTPDPLPTVMAQRIAAMFAADSTAWGRLFVHCIDAVQAQEVRYE